MDFYERKRTRLESFDYSQCGTYFVTICTQNRAKILSDVVGNGSPVPKICGRIAEKMIKQMPEKYPSVSVDKYVIMPDHIHLLITINAADDELCSSNIGTGNPSPTISTIIGWYKYQVTKQINQMFAHQASKVFQRSYYDHIVRNQSDYNECWDYIDKNPQKWIADKKGRG